MSKRNRRVRSTAGVIVAALAVSVTSSMTTATAAPAQPARPAEAASDPITLISGDVVAVKQANGHADAIVTKTRPGISYQVYNRAEQLFVVPSDAEPALRSGVVDESLFDVKYLADNGYSDKNRGNVPVIASYNKGKRLDANSVRAKAAALPATKSTHTLDSIGAQAAEVDKGKTGQLWTAITTGKAAVQRLSLDRKVTASLAESVPQVKAPQAWAAGYDGAGVKVAVLDTGADATHPDLAGRITTATSFVPAEQDNIDRNGHGTHVAATVGGSGAASGGSRKGVAPGAQLAIGKVLDGSGNGQESWIINGMQWAATTAQAKVVSLSLGSGVQTVGDDPMSQAVESLTAQTGALFVIAAGNSGPGPWTIAAPGAAASALTVGAVDKADVVAGFSSRGPRIDGVLKPEVAAPGVNIVAARATGTSMGSPVDANYTSASGTSMAAPHVAGEAAILAQRNPSWTGAQLKAGLMGSADDLGKPANHQGAGRINAQRAIAETVLAGPAAVGFGNIDPSVTTNQTRTITYSNTGTSAVTLSFSARLTDDTGAAAPAGSLSLSHTSLAVPAGGNATLTLTVNPNNLVKNVRYSGVVTATGAGAAGTVVTPIAANRTVLRTVTLKVIGFDGQPVYAPCSLGDSRCITGTLFPVDASGGQNSFQLSVVNGQVSAVVPEGTYSADIVGSPGADPELVPARISAIKPQIVIDANKEIVFDLRDLKKVTVQTPNPSTNVAADMFFKRTSANGAARGLHVWPGEHTSQYMSPTESVTVGALDHQFQTSRIRSQLDVTVGSSSWYPTYYTYTSVDGSGTYKSFTGSQTLTAVFGGAGAQSFFDSTNVAGKLVLIEHVPGDSIRTIVERANSKGAAGVVVYDATGQLPIGAGDGGELIPVAYLTKAEGLAFKAALPGGSAQATVAGAPSFPFAYHLAFDTIPANPAFVVQGSALTSVSSSFHSSTANASFGSVDGIRRGVTSPILSLTPGLNFRAPSTHTDLYGPATPWLTWERIVNTPSAMWTTDNVFNNPSQAQSESWNRQPLRLGQAQWNLDIAGNGSYYFLSRQGNTFYPVPQLLDGYNTEHGGQPQLPDGTKVQIGLKRNGQAVAGRTEDLMTVFDVPAASDAYELSLKYQPNGTGSGVYRTDTTYGFTSAQATQEESTGFFMCGRDKYVPVPNPSPCENQKIDIIDYDVNVDLDNTMPVGVQRAAFFKLHPLKGSPTTESLQAWISTNEGASWTALSLTPLSNGNYGTILNNPSVGNVSLKVTATDTAGSTITETLYNAYRVK